MTHFLDSWSSESDQSEELKFSFEAQSLESPTQCTDVGVNEDIVTAQHSVLGSHASAELLGGGAHLVSVPLVSAHWEQVAVHHGEIVFPWHVTTQEETVEGYVSPQRELVISSERSPRLIQYRDSGWGHHAHPPPLTTHQLQLLIPQEESTEGYSSHPTTHERVMDCERLSHLRQRLAVGHGLLRHPLPIQYQTPDSGPSHSPRRQSGVRTSRDQRGSGAPPNTFQTRTQSTRPHPSDPSPQMRDRLVQQDKRNPIQYGWLSVGKNNGSQETVGDLFVRTLEAGTHTGAFIWKIPDIARCRREAVEGRTVSVYSPPFYARGYQMCLRLYLNGDGTGEGTHISLFFVLMKGEHDNLLSWPFKHPVTLTLLPADGHESHIRQSIHPDSLNPFFQRPLADMNIASGCPQFAPISVLSNTHFVADDALYIKVKVQLRVE